MAQGYPGDCGLLRMQPAVNPPAGGGTELAGVGVKFRNRGGPAAATYLPRPVRPVRGIVLTESSRFSAAAAGPDLLERSRGEVAIDYPVPGKISSIQELKNIVQNSENGSIVSLGPGGDERESSISDLRGSECRVLKGPDFRALEGEVGADSAVLVADNAIARGGRLCKQAVDKEKHGVKGKLHAESNSNTQEGEMLLLEAKRLHEGSKLWLENLLNFPETAAAASHVYRLEALNTEVEREGKAPKNRMTLLSQIALEETRKGKGIGKGKKDRKHTAVARALTHCLRGIHTPIGVREIILGAEEKLSLVAISSALSKLGQEGNSPAVLALLQWMRQRCQAQNSTWKGRVGELQVGVDTARGDSPQACVECQRKMPPHQFLHADYQSRQLTEAGAEDGTMARNIQTKVMGSLFPNVFTYNAALAALRMNRDWAGMDKVSTWMQEDAIQADSVTLNIYLAAYLDRGMDDVAWEMLAKAVEKSRPCPDLFSVRTMIPAVFPLPQEGGSYSFRTTYSMSELENAWTRAKFLLDLYSQVSKRFMKASSTVQDNKVDNVSFSTKASGPEEEILSVDHQHSRKVDFSTRSDSAATVDRDDCRLLGVDPSYSLRTSWKENVLLQHRDKSIGKPGPAHAIKRQQQQQSEVERCLRMCCTGILKALFVYSLAVRDMQSKVNSRKVQGVLHPGTVKQPISDTDGFNSFLDHRITAEGKQSETDQKGKEERLITVGVQKVSAEPDVCRELEDDLQERTVTRGLHLEAGGLQVEAGGLPVDSSHVQRDTVASEIDAFEFLQRMKVSGIHADGHTYYWVLRTLCLDPLAQQRCIRLLYKEMRSSCYLPDLRLCNAIISALVQAKKWWAALEVYEDMRKWGPHPSLETDALILGQFNFLLDAARKRRLWKWSLQLLLRMKDSGVLPNAHSWRTALVTCAKANETAAAVRLFKDMVEAGHSADALAYGALLSALEKGRQWGQAEEVWQHMMKIGVSANLQAYTTMIILFGAQGHYSRAVSLFQEMKEKKIKPDVPVYNAMISSCAIIGDGVRAVEWLHKIEGEGLTPTSTSYEQVVLALCNQGNWEAAKSVVGSMISKELDLSGKCRRFLQRYIEYLAPEISVEEFFEGVARDQQILPAFEQLHC